MHRSTVALVAALAAGLTGLTAPAQAAPQRPSAVDRLRAALGPQGVVDIGGATGTPRVIARLDGLLTGPSSAAPASVALAYVRAHDDVFRLTPADLAGLHLRRDYVDVAGIHHLSWVQEADGVPLFGHGLQAAVTRDGRLVEVFGAPVASLHVPAAVRSLSPQAALATAHLDAGDTSSAPSGGDSAAPVLFFAGTGGVRRAWQTLTLSGAHPSLHVIDAATGRVVFRRSLQSDANAPAPAAATGNAVDYFPGAPHGGTAHTVNYTAAGWLSATATTLSGNNAHAYSDVNDNDRVDAGEEVHPTSGSAFAYRLTPFALSSVSFCGHPYPCTWNPAKAYSWRTNRAQNATQVFYFVNRWHDHLLAAPIGFTEAAGNFQQVNRTGKGKGGDAVRTETDDGANTDHGLPDADHVDNANMVTPPDGSPPRMQMYLQHEPGTSYPGGDPFAPTDVGDEADTVYHDYTHGLSNRLVVDADGNSTLGVVQAGAMGEAWSDWYAMDYLVSQGLQPDTAASGDVVLFQFDGAGVKLDRTEPIDCPVGATTSRCPGTARAGRGGYTYGDFGRVASEPEVHADGEIWAQTLWDLRGRLGSTRTESLVTRAMELSPANPSFLDERDAILAADNAVYGGHDVATIWKVFAHRGMGWKARSAGGDDTLPHQDFSLPPNS